jgi:hypothetical protein
LTDTTVSPGFRLIAATSSGATRLVPNPIKMGCDACDGSTTYRRHARARTVYMQQRVTAAIFPGKERALQLHPGSFLAANNLSRRSVKLVFTGILSDAVPERPILLLDLNEAHQDVLATQTRVSGEIVRDCGEQRLLLIKRACIVTGNLNHR